MPHTSRKKQQGSKKRLQIIDDSGWTHISKGTSRQKHELQSKSWLNDKLSPAKIPRCLTIKDVGTTFEKHMQIWKASTCLKNLETLIQDTILTSNFKITNCVCLGLGSFTGGKFPETSYFQLAALLTILELLHQKHDITQIYCQDPVFNSLDEDFLQSLGYTILPTPQGFDKVDEGTFLFAPHLEWPIYLAALRNASPSLCTGNDVREYLESPVERTSEEARTFFEAFVDSHSCRKMPEFERSSWCDSTCVYWREAGEVEDVDGP